MRLASAAAAMLAVAACASDRVDFGGVANSSALSGPAISCQDAGIRYIERAPLTYPAELMQLAYFGQSDGLRVETPFRFDVNRAGEVINLQFAGDDSMTRNSAHRAAIMSAAEHLLSSRFVWPDDADAHYATGCEETIRFGARYTRQP